LLKELEGLDDLVHLRLQLLSMLDPFLKFKINRGVSIFKTYTGFDTEYDLEDQKKFRNKLLSDQTAIQSQTLIKIPVYSPYCISYGHP
jgi:hypothetical protein